MKKSAEQGLLEKVVADLRARDLVYEKDNATWFKSSAFGQEQDRVIIKSSGEPTYRLPDIAYHREKFARGFDWMINIFGSDHIATVPDVLAGLRALGLDDSRVTVVLYQFVTLMRGGKQVKMFTRRATFVTVDELVDDVGSDAMRFFFLMRKPDNLRLLARGRHYHTTRRSSGRTVPWSTQSAMILTVHSGISDWGEVVTR